MGNKKYPNLCEDSICTGCMACVNTCNNGALSITVDREGFYRPALNQDKCLQCGLCELSCPILTPLKRHKANEQTVFAVWHKDDNVRLKSTSGGAFTALAEVVLKNGGVVYGAAYSEDLKVSHIEVSDTAGLEKLRGSKYAQSCIGEVMKCVKKRLNEGRLVLFVGTPCQVAGLKLFLHKEYDNLLLVDFICHGVASNNILQSYVNWIEQKFGKVRSINFRDKRKGWYDSLRVITSELGREYVLRGSNDSYWVAYNNNCNDLQYSCYNCLVQLFPRCSDITIADFWRIGTSIPFGHQNEIEKGVSLLSVNNLQKMPIVQEAAKCLFIEERDASEIMIGNKAALQPSVCPSMRTTFYEDLNTMDFNEFKDKYMRTSIKQKAIKIFREYLPYSVIKYVRMKKQK